MVFRVEIAPCALADLDDISTYIQQHESFEQSEKWFNDMIDAMTSLKEAPSRCPIADASQLLGQEIRFLLHGKRNHAYKIYFSIDHKSRTVRIFHIRHWAMKALRRDALRALMAETPAIRKRPKKK